MTEQKLNLALKDGIFAVLFIVLFLHTEGVALQ